MKRNRLCLFSCLVAFFAFAISMQEVAFSENNGENKMGCYPDGTIFNSFAPDAVKLRSVAFLTEFGTLNSNVVLGDSPSGVVSMRAMDLSERIGEYLQAINTTSSAEIGLVASAVPEKYLQERTIILCGGPQENTLVKKLVDDGKSKVNWKTETKGKIEVIPNAFGGPGSAVILGGSDPEGAQYAISALSEFFKHLTGAGLVEAQMLQADKQLQRGDVKGAADSYTRLVDGLRIDGSASFYAPIKDMSPDFPVLLKEEVDMSVAMAKFLRKNPTPEEANAKLREVAKKCAYCHKKYLSYDRMSPNRVKYLYSQYPNARLESTWAKTQ